MEPAVFSVALIAVTLYLILSGILGIASYKTRKALKNINSGKTGIKVIIYENTIGRVIRFAARFIRLENGKREKLVRNLKKAGITVTAEEYAAKAIVLSAISALSALIFLAAGMQVAVLGSVLLATAVYFNEKQKVQKRIRRINEEILLELPKFIRTFTYSLKGTGDTVKIFEKYRKVAGEAFKYDLDVLITGMKSGNHEEALQKFDERINIPQLSSFISGVIGREKGIDQTSFFHLMEQEMKVLARENLKREISRRPAKVKLATWAAAGCLILIFFIPLLMSIVEGMQVFK